MRSPEKDYKSIIHELVQKVNDLDKKQRESIGNSPLFDIANENTPTVLGASQNNYDPGNYDVLRLESSLAVNISGISGGKKGRFLEVINVGTFNVSLLHESALSTAANRIVNSTLGTIVLTQYARRRLYYDSTLERWIA